MTEKKNDYLKMLEIFSLCVDSVRGKKFSGKNAWRADAEGLAVKLFFHLGSSLYLQEGTTLPQIAGVTPKYIDFPSISNLTRTAFETYLCFQYIFVQPDNDEEKSFRHDIWELGGFLDRQRFIVTTKYGKDKIEKEKKQSTNSSKKSGQITFLKTSLKKGKKKRLKVNGD